MYSATIDPSSLPRNWWFTFPFCSCNQERHSDSFCATWKCQTRGSTRKKKGSLPVTLEVWTEKNFRSKERTTFISLHALCTQCFAHLSVSPTFLRATFWSIAPICQLGCKWMNVLLIFKFMLKKRKRKKRSTSSVTLAIQICVLGLCVSQEWRGVNFSSFKGIGPWWAKQSTMTPNSFFHRANFHFGTPI